MTDVVRSLREILGPEHVLTGEPAERYEWDALGPSRGFRGYAALEPKPLCVARPATTTDVSRIVAACAAAGTPVVAYGGGSGLMGGAMAVEPAAIVDLTRMDGIGEISHEDLSVQVEAGVVLEALAARLDACGLMLGHDPWTLPVATVGGATATDSLGYRGARYGPMGAQVLGLTAVVPDGSVVTTRPVGKASVGPDLRSLFVGSEGCFGIVTEAVLRVFPKPEERLLAAFEFPRFEDGFRAILDMRRIGLAPAVLDYGESYAPDGPEPLPPTLYLGFEGFREEAMAQESRARRVCTEHAGKDLGPEEAREFWEHRHDIGRRFGERRAQATRRPEATGSFDYIHVSLQASRVLEYRETCATILQRQGARPLEFGLWCWPELFSAVIAHPEGGDAGRAALAEAVDEMLSLAQDWHGSMEYCHGVGVRLAHMMGREHGEAGMRLLQSLKAAVDPVGIMNPGKLDL